MKSLSNELQEAKNKLEQIDPWVALLAIEFSGANFYFTDNGEPITFSGNTYVEFPFELSGIKNSDSGKVPTVDIKVSNVNKLLMPYLEESGGLVGADVTLTIVNTAYVAENYADLTMSFTVLAASVDSQWVTLNLGAPSPLRQKFPPDRYLAASCAWEFKSVECAYSGTDTSCSRTYSDCLDKENVARFGGFYGLSPDGFKVVY